MTATGVLLLVALVGSVAYFLYALTVREADQIPFMAAGLVVLGIVFIAIGVIVRAAGATWAGPSPMRSSAASACLAAAGCFAHAGSAAGFCSARSLHAGVSPARRGASRAKWRVIAGRGSASVGEVGRPRATRGLVVGPSDTLGGAFCPHRLEA